MQFDSIYDLMLHTLSIDYPGHKFKFNIVISDNKNKKILRLLVDDIVWYREEFDDPEELTYLRVFSIVSQDLRNRNFS